MVAVANKWDALGIKLHFDIHELKAISRNVTGANSRVEFVFDRVISAWLDGPTANVTKQNLVEALKVIQFANLASKIENEGMVLSD